MSRYVDPFTHRHVTRPARQASSWGVDPPEDLEPAWSPRSLPITEARAAELERIGALGHRSREEAKARVGARPELLTKEWLALVDAEMTRIREGGR
jgi:hypothetical protein